MRFIHQVAVLGVEQDILWKRALPPHLTPQMHRICTASEAVFCGVK